MTKKELLTKIEEFIELQDEHNRDDWYVTEQEMAQHVLYGFANHLGIKLEP
jgi:hypothetical protein